MTLLDQYLTLVDLRYASCMNEQLLAVFTGLMYGSMKETVLP